MTKKSKTPLEYLLRPVAALIPNPKNARTHSESQIAKIAAETEGRVCYGVEINPVYVDVIIKRWQEFTGRMAILESTGGSFADASTKGN